MPYEYEPDDEDADYTDPYTEVEWVQDLTRRRQEAAKISNWEWSNNDVF